MAKSVRWPLNESDSAGLPCLCEKKSRSRTTTAIASTMSITDKSKESMPSTTIFWRMKPGFRLDEFCIISNGIRLRLRLDANLQISALSSNHDAQMNQRKVALNDLTAVLFQPVPEHEIHPQKSALLLINFIDCTGFFVQVAVDKGIPENEAKEVLGDFDRAAKEAAVNAGRLLKACRASGLEILHIRSEARTDRKTRLIVPSGNEAAVYEALASRKGELVVPESSGDAFTETRLDYVLRNMNIDSLIVCGLTTDQGVLFTAAKAVDLGYDVVLVEDACATFTQETHSTFIKWFKTFVNVKTTQEMLSLIK